MNSYLLHLLRFVFILALPASALGLVLGAAWGWGLFSFGLLCVLARDLHYLGRLSAWAARSLSESVPEGDGLWGEVFTLLYKRQRAELRKRGRLARVLARSRRAGRALPYGVAILDAERRIIWCNDSSTAHFGTDLATDIGQPITNLVRQPEFIGYVRKGDFAAPLQLRTERADGMLLSVQFVPYLESQQLLLSHDVTQAEKLEQVRRDFVANVSHELRTPLTVLVGFLETLRELKLDPQRSRDYLKLMAEQSQRMQRIIEDLLTLSSLESAPLPAGDSRVSMTELLARLVTDAEGLSAGRHRIALQADADFDLLGAESELASAFGNLVSNAIRYTPAGGEVHLIWHASPSGAAFTVVDTGLGIAPDHIARLTERFYRVNRGRSRETGGTGLGLAIAKHALARNQATLKIESEPGKGSRFSAHFPASRIVRAHVADSARTS